jgi:Protein of unknown function (DUF1566)
MRRRFAVLCGIVSSGCLNDWAHRSRDAGDDGQVVADAGAGQEAGRTDREDAGVENDAGPGQSELDGGQPDRQCIDCGLGSCNAATMRCVCPAELGIVASVDGLRCDDIDECKSASCSAEYPCRQTDPPGYTCLGQFADWQMPEAQDGPLPSYDTSSRPGVVIDLVTGLWWQRAVEGRGFTLADAIAYCAALPLAGHDDWRMPTMIELASITDHSKYGPAIDTTAFPSTPGDFFWTSSSAHDGLQFLVAFHDGDSGPFDPATPSRARCVRTGSFASGTPVSRFVFNGADGTVLDQRTRLTWLLEPTGKVATWDSASALCASFGMRLPTLKQLLTLVDPTASTPAVHPALAGRVSSALSWTSVTDVNPIVPAGSKWSVDFRNGTGSDITSDPQHFSCVR